MTHPQRPDEPRHPRGSSSWAQRINEGTGEWLTAILRVLSVVWSLWFVGALFGLIWAPSWGWGLTAALSLLLTAVHVWAGFVWLANPEWSAPDDDA